MSLVWLLCSATSAGDLMYGDYVLEIGANGSMARGVASTISVGNLVAEATSLTTSSSGPVTEPPAPPAFEPLVLVVCLKKIYLSYLTPKNVLHVKYFTFENVLLQNK